MHMTALQSDITTLAVDAIVNAANQTLLGNQCRKRHPVRYVMRVTANRSPLRFDKGLATATRYAKGSCR